MEIPGDRHERHDRRQRAPAKGLGLCLLGYALVVAGVVALAPFRFAAPDEARLTWRGNEFDLAANFAFFFVPGFFYRMATGATRDGWCVGPLAMGVFASACIEAAQLFLPGRCASPLDLGANAVGAWFGALAYDSVRRNLDARLAGVLALELPLMGLFYLLTPLLWLHGLAGALAWGGVVPAVVLGLLGGTILAAVWAHRLGPARVVSAEVLAFLAGAWFLVATVPTVHARTWLLAACAAGIAVATRAETALLARRAARERRFEAATLGAVWPLFAAYLLAVALSPPARLSPLWRASSWIAEFGSHPDKPAMLAFLEYVAAFAVGGWMLAESRGRRDGDTGRGHLLVGAVAVAAAAGLEALRGFHPAHGASLLHCLLAVASGLFGAAAYRHQLAAVRARRLGSARAVDGVVAEAAGDLVERRVESASALAHGVGEEAPCGAGARER